MRALHGEFQGQPHTFLILSLSFSFPNISRAAILLTNSAVLQGGNGTRNDLSSRSLFFFYFLFFRARLFRKDTSVTVRGALRWPQRCSRSRATQRRQRTGASFLFSSVLSVEAILGAPKSSRTARLQPLRHKSHHRCGATRVCGGQRKVKVGHKGPLVPLSSAFILLYFFCLLVLSSLPKLASAKTRTICCAGLEARGHCLYLWRKPQMRSERERNKQKQTVY